MMSLTKMTYRAIGVGWIQECFDRLRERWMNKKPYTLIATNSLFPIVEILFKNIENGLTEGDYGFLVFGDRLQLTWI